jgi:hypothetical protein
VNQIIRQQGGEAMATPTTGPDPEALAWLSQTPPPVGVFLHKELRPVAEGVRLVETLYALGAVRVTVPAWAVKQVLPARWPGGRPGGSATCGFEVTLPDAGPDREALIWFIASECGEPRWGPGVPLDVLRAHVGCKTVELAWV